MEFADGGDLLGKISQHKRSRSNFTEEELWNFALQLFRGLKKLHSMRILHRDIKCANVFVCKDGTVKIGDLNVSKVNKKGLAYTQTGTPYYASPEVWKDQPYDSKSDIWSVGCVLYEAAALHPPFRGNSMDELYSRVIRGQYPPLPATYSEDLHNLVRSLLQVNPSLRPSVEQLTQMPLVIRHDISTRKLEATIQGGLLGTIELPRNMSHLAGRFPAPRYERRELSVPAIRMSEPAPLIPRPPSHARLQSQIFPEVQRKRLRAYGLDVVHRQPVRERQPLQPLSKELAGSRANLLPQGVQRAEDPKVATSTKMAKGDLKSHVQPLRPRPPPRAVVPKWWN
jgi:NIMA (never in mitosis gene a)-related kinase